MASSHVLQLLVPTRLEPPLPGTTWIWRERLMAGLGPAPRSRLTLVVAPAGFGKSTLVAQWLRGAAGAPVAWLTLDEHDQGGLTFLAYVAAAVERAAPGALEAALQLLRSPEPPPPYLVMQALLVGLSELPAGLTLVLDDYHLVDELAVHQLVAYLLRNMPPRCHLVILSRVDLPFSLARLRAERQVMEVRSAELRFTEAEVAALLASLLGGAPEAALVAALHQQTEGWAIALQLAALARPGAPAGAYAAGGAGQIAEYLADEVFDRQPRDVQALLLALAVPERFCPELGAALLGAPGDHADAESRIEGLVRANLLLTPLDGEGRWFRFHHLFRDLLLRRLRLTAGQGRLHELQLRAARWLAGAGLAEEAVRLFLAAGDEGAAADLVEGQLIHEAGISAPNAALAAWLAKLPAGLIAARPGLALIAAHLAAVNLDLPALAAGLEAVDAIVAEAGRPVPWPTFPQDLAALRGTLECWRGRPDAAASALGGALSGGVLRTFAGRATILLGLALVGQGRYDEAVRQASAGWGLPPPERELYRQASLAGVHLAAGELAALERLAQPVAEAAARQGNDTTVAYLAICLGAAAYERSDLAAAAGHFGTAVTRKYRVNFTTYMSAVVGLALVAAAQGADEDAAAYAHEAAATAGEVGGAFFTHQALGLQARLALARDDLPAALRAAQAIVPDIHLGPSPWLETPRLSQARALIAGGGEAQLAQAEETLAGCLAEVEPLHNIRLLIAALATQALLRQAQGRHAEAAAALERAVGLAAPRGFVRSFVDCGPALLAPLRALAARGAASAHLRRVIAAYEPAALPRARPVQAATQLPELLTRREAEILTLLAERWSDKEIAERLVIAPNTVRKHTGTIYEKLGVGNRREAVDVARALGLLGAG